MLLDWGGKRAVSVIVFLFYCSVEGDWPDTISRLRK